MKLAPNGGTSKQDQIISPVQSCTYRMGPFYASARCLYFSHGPQTIRPDVPVAFFFYDADPVHVRRARDWTLLCSDTLFHLLDEGAVEREGNRCVSFHRGPFAGLTGQYHDAALQHGLNEDSTRTV